MQNYVIHPVRAIRDNPDLVPGCGGLYGFMMEDPSPLVPALVNAGLTMDVMGLGGTPMLYIGASNHSLRGRVKSHLRNDTMGSSLRMSLGALLADQLQLKVAPYSQKSVFGFVPEDEGRLTQWMCDHLQVAWRSSNMAFEIEKQVIQHDPPTLNIAGRPTRTGAWQLLLLRRRCVDRTQPAVRH